MSSRQLARQDCSAAAGTGRPLDYNPSSDRIDSPARPRRRRNRLYRTRATPAVHFHGNAAGRAGEPLFPARHRRDCRRREGGLRGAGGCALVLERVRDAGAPLACPGRRARHIDHESSGVELFLDFTPIEPAA